MCDCGCYHLHRTSNSSSLIVWYPFDLIVLVSVCFWVHSFLVTCCCHFLIFEGPCSIRHITHVLLFYQFNIYNLSPILKKVWTQVPFCWLQGLSIVTSCHLTYSPLSDGSACVLDRFSHRALHFYLVNQFLLLMHTFSICWSCHSPKDITWYVWWFWSLGTVDLYFGH